MNQNRIRIEQENCTLCGKCVNWCPKDAITVGKHPKINYEICIFCGECMIACPEDVFEVRDLRANQEIYEGFSEVYKTGKYPEFSEAMADLLPDILDQFEVKGKKLLDIACGEGTFAVKMAEKGYDVVGIDISPRQIKYAEEKDKEGKVDFIIQDMRDLSFNEDFDIATCWYDSLNYILDKGELKRVFEGVHSALHENGIFVFDMNTIYVMEEVWNEQTMVKEDSAKRFDMVEQNYDEEKKITSLKLTSFLREGDSWRKIEEVHRERGYSFEDLRDIFNRVGFKELASWKDIREREKIDEETERAWFVLRK